MGEAQTLAIGRHAYKVRSDIAEHAMRNAINVGEGADAAHNIDARLTCENSFQALAGFVDGGRKELSGFAVRAALFSIGVILWLNASDYLCAKSFDFPADGALTFIVNELEILEAHEAVGVIALVAAVVDIVAGLAVGEPIEKQVRVIEAAEAVRVVGTDPAKGNGRRADLAVGSVEEVRSTVARIAEDISTIFTARQTVVAVVSAAVTFIITVQKVGA